MVGGGVGGSEGEGNSVLTPASSAASSLTALDLQVFKQQSQFRGSGIRKSHRRIVSLRTVGKEICGTSFLDCPGDQSLWCSNPTTSCQTHRRIFSVVFLDVLVFSASPHPALSLPTTYFLDQWLSDSCEQETCGGDCTIWTPHPTAGILTYESRWGPRNLHFKQAHLDLLAPWSLDHFAGSCNGTHIRPVWGYFTVGILPCLTYVTKAGSFEIGF